MSGAKRSRPHSASGCSERAKGIISFVLEENVTWNNFFTIKQLPPILGSRLEIKCDEGFFMNGSAVAVCLESGEWNSTSTCVAISCPGISTEHLTLPESKMGKIATIQCPVGMVMLSGGKPVRDKEVKWQCGKQGQWTNLTEAPVDPQLLSCVSEPVSKCALPEVI